MKSSNKKAQKDKMKIMTSNRNDPVNTTDSSDYRSSDD